MHLGDNDWIEEALFRGRPGPNGGLISGAHLRIGSEVTMPDGSVERMVGKPQPVALTEGETGIALADVLNEVTKAQARTMVEMQAEIDDLTREMAARDDLLQESKEKAQALQNEVKRLEDEVARLSAEN